MSDDETIDDVEYEDGPVGISLAHPVVLVALGVAAALAVALAVARKRVPAPQLVAVPQPEHDPELVVDGEDWRVSLQHLADVISYRLDTIGLRIEALEQRDATIGREPITLPSEPDEEVPPPPQTAAVSLVP